MTDEDGRDVLLAWVPGADELADLLGRLRDAVVVVDAALVVAWGNTAAETLFGAVGGGRG
ncbi:MAG: hypothetical protein NVSMB16_08740 [Acidimicrobiales bacterium]